MAFFNTKFKIRRGIEGRDNRVNASKLIVLDILPTITRFDLSEGEIAIIVDIKINHRSFNDMRPT